jgi:hypothetical protein
VQPPAVVLRRDVQPPDWSEEERERGSWICKSRIEKWRNRVWEGGGDTETKAEIEWPQEGEIDIFRKR